MQGQGSPHSPEGAWGRRGAGGLTACPKHPVFVQVDGLAIPLTPPAERAAKSKLGAYFARRPSGGRHLFTEGSPVKGGARGTELASLRVYVAADAPAA